MMAPFRLSDGTTSNYGYGWGLAEYGGHAVAEHSGGINGFRCHVVRIADANVYVAVLSNDGIARPQRNSAWHGRSRRCSSERRWPNRPRPRFRRQCSTSSRAATPFRTTGGSRIARDGDHLRLDGPAAMACFTPYAAISSRNTAASRSTSSSVMRTGGSTASSSRGGDEAERGTKDP